MNFIINFQVVRGDILYTSRFRFHVTQFVSKYIVFTALKGSRFFPCLGALSVG